MYDKTQPFALDQIITGYREGRPYVKIILIDGRESSAFYQEITGKIVKDAEQAANILHSRFVTDLRGKKYKGYKKTLHDDIIYNLRRMKNAPFEI